MSKRNEFSPCLTATICASVFYVLSAFLLSLILRMSTGGPAFTALMVPVLVINVWRVLAVAAQSYTVTVDRLICTRGIFCKRITKVLWDENTQRATAFQQSVIQKFFNVGDLFFYTDNPKIYIVMRNIKDAEVAFFDRKYYQKAKG